tara:strand:+ start:201 stop:470 length:270 start_codon:yes stop_codon:yes gene_type:complete
MELHDWMDVWVPDSWCWKGVSSPLAGKKIYLRRAVGSGTIEDCIVSNGSIIGIEREELEAVLGKFSPADVKSRLSVPITISDLITKESE